jgi:N6-adenosine-specific RNA methylase IME4
MSQELVLQLRDNAQLQLAKIKDVETGVEYLNKVKAMEVWVKAEKKDSKLQNMVAAQKIRVQRIIGQLTIKGQQDGTIASQNTGGRGTNQYAGMPDGNTSTLPQTLSEIGLSAKQSSTFKAIASIPEAKFEATLAAASEEVADLAASITLELTTAALVRIARKDERDILKAELAARSWPEGKYRIFYADPPWEYTSGDQHATEEQATVLGTHYPSMTIADLCALDIKSMAEENAVLFLWVTSPLLDESFEVIKAWGFEYKASMVWDKVKHNVGHYVSVRHEFILICTKGSCKPDIAKLYDSVLTIERTEHSRKPEEVRAIIDEIYPYGKRVELFARVKAEGWDSWGNEE